MRRKMAERAVMFAVPARYDNDKTKLYSEDTILVNTSRLKLIHASAKYPLNLLSSLLCVWLSLVLKTQR